MKYLSELASKFHEESSLNHDLSLPYTKRNLRFSTMKKRIFSPLAAPALAALTLSTLSVNGQEAKNVVPMPNPATEIVADDEAEAALSATAEELAELSHTNSLRDEKLKAELADMKAQIERLKLEKQLISEQQALKDAKRELAQEDAKVAANEIQTKADQEAALAKSKAAYAESMLALQKTQWEEKTEKMTAEMKELEAVKLRDNFADSKPVYLENPLKDDGTLVISDRRIALNGPIASETADYITARIHYYNNKNRTQPIFIVIDDSPGGSVMAGYRILKAMEGSEAPIHVVVKSFAASMAASITTLAEESYAYPNALILHHQLSSSYFFTTMNLTQQKEAFEDAKKWWDKLASPIAKKMGVSNDEFIKQMYEKNSDGDWVEFGTDAQKLKWVNHIVQRIEETALVINPDSVATEDAETESIFDLKESVGKDGKPCMYLPRINPHDVYFLHNPDGYYRMRK